MKAERKALGGRMEEETRVNIGLSGSDRDGVVGILNTLLSDEYLMYTKVRNYHWNVVSSDFSELHKFFEQGYEALNDIVDDVAERVRSMGGFSLGTLEEFLKHTRLVERPGQYPAAEEMLSNLLTDQEAVIRHLRKDLETAQEVYHDAGTNNFLIDLMERHEKMAWMLRSYLVRGRT